MSAPAASCLFEIPPASAPIPMSMLPPITPDMKSSFVQPQPGQMAFVKHSVTGDKIRILNVVCVVDGQQYCFDAKKSALAGNLDESAPWVRYHRYSHRDWDTVRSQQVFWECPGCLRHPPYLHATCADCSTARPADVPPPKLCRRCFETFPPSFTKGHYCLWCHTDRRDLAQQIRRTKEARANVYRNL